MKTALRVMLVAGLSLYTSLASAQDKAQDKVPENGLQWRHANSLTGVPKYPAGFKHYDYVNPDAPKGGMLNQVTVGTFDSLNPYVVQGVAAAGLANFGGGMLYDTLMDQSMDQSSTTYGMIAEAMQFPDDFSWVKFRLNPKAAWHDKTPISVEDVIWSFETLKKQSPLYNRYYSDVVKAEKTGNNEVTFTFDKAGNRELPNIMGDLVVLPKHWWEGKDKNGKQRDISRPTLETPLGSSAYKIASVNAGKSIIWQRVDDYWGKDQPTQVGRNNFDQVKYEYFLNNDATWEAFKKGGVYDYRQENIAQRWQEQYNFPAFERGDVIKASFPMHAAGRMQGAFLNTRKAKLQDVRVREALNWVFDFESMNRMLFFNQYKRIESYFAGIDLASSGLPSEAELKILETVRGEIPEAVFTKPYKLPVFDTPQATRTNIRHALDLLAQAGWVVKDGKLTNNKGEVFTLEFLTNNPNDERVVSPFINNLRRVGINASLRVVDDAQYQARVNDFDYDVITSVVAQSQSPGNEQREMWSSQSADLKGSKNYAGIKNPAVDKLIDRVVYAKDYDELVATTRALDRVLLWNYYTVPQWYSDTINIAYWNKFGLPDKQPDYAGIDPFSWWVKPKP
ncbi:extracellular solute-binding protein [Pseudochrobactrum kiredjianiae]|uniref:Extracellular solute-binding protein n=1 Tax=Pseudochrobactrum kiredjianiae TaxID=386305 RepID=A0ABW3V7Y4_9HYPH|nr:extracellular solute-binding protein [Pseudochrobactrum kiredjianiae]MDM7849700.1 extracellular solute-binding protein [Pseudochrobactrum kiredjianiae]